MGLTHRKRCAPCTLALSTASEQNQSGLLSRHAFAGSFGEEKSTPGGFVEDAIQAGDLVLHPPATPQYIANASWTSEFGLASYAIAASFGKSERRKSDANTLEKALFWGLNVFLDGLHWQPLTQDFDYHASWAQIKQEIFAEEFQQLAS